MSAASPRRAIVTGAEGGLGIRCNVVMPGVIATPKMSALLSLARG